MKTDLRIIKSKNAIENAFINLVEIKGFQNITIKEIAEKAMVNRNTIYLNYGTKEEILESIVKTSFFNHFGNLTTETFRKIGLNKKKIEDLFKKLFIVIDENIELYRILFTDSSSSGYLRTELTKLRKALENWIKPTLTNKIRASFLMNGIIGVVSNYITLAVGTAEDNVKILTDLTLSNLRHMSYTKKL